VKNSEDDLLRLAAALEIGSEHPLATAILNEAKVRGISIEAAANFQSITGEGIEGEVAGKKLHLGNRTLMERDKIISSHSNSEESENRAEEWGAAGITPIYLAQEGELLGMLGIADPIKAGAEEAIANLKEIGVNVVMLTGDNQKTAEAVATQIGLDKNSVVADLLPAEKIKQVAQLQQQGEVVAMVGDGINDAPALAQADVGIAIGTGTDIAIESADIALMHGALQGVVDAITLSRATMENIKQNLFGAFIYNTLGIPIAAGVLFPLFGVMLTPIVAAAAMSMSSVTVVTNALRLRSVRLSKGSRS